MAVTARDGALPAPANRRFTSQEADPPAGGSGFTRPGARRMSRFGTTPSGIPGKPGRDISRRGPLPGHEGTPARDPAPARESG